MLWCRCEWCWIVTLVLVRGAVLFPVVVVTVVPLVQLVLLRVVMRVWMLVLALMQVWMSAPVLSWMSS